MKSLKFYTSLAQLIEQGEKTTTWRLFDDKDLRVGDTLQFINKDTGAVFGTGAITHIKVTTLGALVPEDWGGHESFTTTDEMYATYRSYYGDGVTPETELKVVRFTFSPC